MPDPADQPITEPDEGDEPVLVLPDGSPAHPPSPTDGTDPEGAGRAARSHYSPMAVIARVPLPVRRITKVQVAALVVFTLISLGPALALVIVLRSDTSTIPVVVTEDQITAVDGLNLGLTVTSVNAVTREMGIRMTVRSSSQEAAGLIQAGRMTETVTIAVPAPPGSLQGNYTITLEQGETVGAVEFVAQMGDGSIARYPYDTYESDIYLIASRDAASASDPTGGNAADSSSGTSTGAGSGSGSAPDPATTRIPVPISVEVTADVPGFVISGDLPADGRSESARNIALDVRRNGPTLLYTTWIMFLWWALSVSAVCILWSVAIWRSSPPAWAYGYLVGVLFALAPLRGALPGQPPYGVLIDYVSFYWAVGTMGVGLLILVSFFVRDAREDGRTTSREQEQLDDRAADVAYDGGEVPNGVPVAAVPALPVALGTEVVVEGAGTPAAERAADRGPEPSAPTNGDAATPSDRAGGAT